MIDQQLWSGNCASLALLKIGTEEHLVLRQTYGSYLPNVEGMVLTKNEARALAAVLLEFARDK